MAKSYAENLLGHLLDSLSDMTNTQEYQNFVKFNKHFRYSDDVMKKIRNQNPAYTKATTATTWDNVFGRRPKPNEKAFKVQVAKNQEHWLYDVSQTVGKPVSAIYRSISGKVRHYKQILDCLMKYSCQPVEILEGASYYSGASQDSFVEDGKILLRSGLSQQQIIFALVREIVKASQESALVVEAVGHMVCKHLGMDTSGFTVGYILELLEFDSTLKVFKGEDARHTITREAEIFIGFLDSHLDFLQDDESGSEESIDEPSNTQQEEKKPQTEKQEPKTQNQEPPQTQNFAHIHAYTQTQTINGISFYIHKIVREIMNSAPDVIITSETAEAVDEMPLTEYGNFIVDLDDISFNDIENQIWLETALRSFFDTTGTKLYEMPYFTNRNNFETTPEMKKINALMLEYCAYFTTKAIQASKKGVSPTTGKPLYDVPKAVEAVRAHYDDKHILEAMKSLCSNINAPQSVKRAFGDCFAQMRKTHKVIRKKPTPDESIKRTTARKEGGEGNAEIFSII